MRTEEAAAYDKFAHYYNLMVGDRTPYYEFYSSLLVPGQTSLIDIGCGTGSVTAALARILRDRNAGEPVRVAGVDGSLKMLKAAARLDPEVQWIVGDLRDMKAEGQFELAISCYNTLQHVDGAGLAQAFRSIRRVLLVGGRLAFDIYRPNLSYIRIPQVNRLARRIRSAEGVDLELREDTVFDETSGILTIAWRLVEAGRSDNQLWTETCYRMWQHEPEIVEGALDAAGFKITERFGDLDRSAYGVTSKKQVIVCAAQ